MGAEFDRPERGEVLGVLGHPDQIPGVVAVRQRRLALLPDLGDVLLPGLDHPADVGVRSAEQQDVRQQRVAAGEHRQVLPDDRVEQRRHQLIRRHAHLLQAVDVGLGEHAAFAGDRVDLDARVPHVGKLVARDLQLRVDLVDDGARPAGALVVHRRDLLLLARLGVFFEDDDLGVLATELDDRTGLRIELLHCQADRVDFLDELRPDPRCDPPAPGAGDEDPEPVRGNREVRFDPRQELEDLLRLLGVVTLVIAPQDLVGGRVHDHRLDGGRSDIESDDQPVVVAIPVCGAHRPAPGATATRERASAFWSSATCVRKFAATPMRPGACGTLYIADSR